HLAGGRGNRFQIRGRYAGRVLCDGLRRPSRIEVDGRAPAVADESLRALAVTGRHHLYAKRDQGTMIVDQTAVAGCDPNILQLVRNRRIYGADARVERASGDVG